MNGEQERAAAVAVIAYDAGPVRPPVPAVP